MPTRERREREARKAVRDMGKLADMIAAGREAAGLPPHQPGDILDQIRGSLRTLIATPEIDQRWRELDRAHVALKNSVHAISTINHREQRAGRRDSPAPMLEQLRSAAQLHAEIAAEFAAALSEYQPAAEAVRSAEREPE